MNIGSLLEVMLLNERASRTEKRQRARRFSELMDTSKQMSPEELFPDDRFFVYDGSQKDMDAQIKSRVSPKVYRDMALQALAKQTKSFTPEQKKYIEDDKAQWAQSGKRDAIIKALRKAGRITPKTSERKIEKMVRSRLNHEYNRRLLNSSRQQMQQLAATHPEMLKQLSNKDTNLMAAALPQARLIGINKAALDAHNVKDLIDPETGKINRNHKLLQHEIQHQYQAEVLRNMAKAGYGKGKTEDARFLDLLNAQQHRYADLSSLGNGLKLNPNADPKKEAEKYAKDAMEFDANVAGEKGRNSLGKGTVRAVRSSVGMAERPVAPSAGKGVSLNSKVTGSSHEDINKAAESGYGRGKTVERRQRDLSILTDMQSRKARKYIDDYYSSPKDKTDGYSVATWTTARLSPNDTPKVREAKLREFYRRQDAMSDYRDSQTQDNQPQQIQTIPQKVSTAQQVANTQPQPSYNQQMQPNQQPQTIQQPVQQRISNAQQPTQSGNRRMKVLDKSQIRANNNNQYSNTYQPNQQPQTIQQPVQQVQSVPQRVTTAQQTVQQPTIQQQPQVIQQRPVVQQPVQTVQQPVVQQQPVQQVVQQPQPMTQQQYNNNTVQKLRRLKRR